MSWQVARKAIDFMIAESPELERYNLFLFGGEPLLNLNVIKEIVSYCGKMAESGKQFGLSMTTNGTLLTPEVYRYLLESDIGVMVSLDGTKSIHDKNRPFKNGKPSWDHIMRNLSRINDFGDVITARATVLNADTDLMTIYRTLSEAGFKRTALSEVCPNSGNPPTFPPDSIPKWKKDYFELAVHVCDSADSIGAIPILSVADQMWQILSKTKSYYCCYTGLSYFYVTPGGEIYPCSRVITEDKRFLLGSVETGIDRRLVGDFKRNNVFNKVCRSCWARYLCGGQCYGDTFAGNRDITVPDSSFCDLMKHKIEVAAYMLDVFQRQGKLPSPETGSGLEKAGLALRRFWGRLFGLKHEEGLEWKEDSF
jgi:uncharacterized protein